MLSAAQHKGNQASLQDLCRVGNWREGRAEGLDNGESLRSTATFRPQLLRQPSALPEGRTTTMLPLKSAGAEITGDMAVRVANFAGRTALRLLVG